MKIGKLCKGGKRASQQKLYSFINTSEITAILQLLHPSPPAPALASFQSDCSAAGLSNDTVEIGEPVTKSCSDAVVQAGSSQRCERIEIQCRNEDPTRSTAALTLLSLPPELHWHIFSFISVTDAISFGLTNQYFWSIGRESLDDYFASFFGRWAGMNIVCVDADIQAGDYPPGLFSAEELEVLRHERSIPPDDGYSRREIVWSVPFTLAHFAFPDISRTVNFYSIFQLQYSLLKHCVRRDIVQDPAFRSAMRSVWGVKGDTDFSPERWLPEYVGQASSLIRPGMQMWGVKDDTYFPEDQTWILRNLTTKQIVRPEAIALSPDYIHGPNIAVIGFGEVVISRTCWSRPPSVDAENTTDISRGVWAGHRFDITTLSRHEAETKTYQTEWSDVSDEVGREVAAIWERQYGADWRVIARNRWADYYGPPEESITW